jgi:O-antigen/teichoic acid export membrane protein
MMARERTDEAMPHRVEAKQNELDARQLILNSGMNIVAFLFFISSNLLVVPLVLKMIGLDAFGRAGLVLVVCVPLLLIGTVVSQALISLGSVSIGDSNPDGLRRTFSASVRAYGLASLTAGFVLITFGPWIASFFAAANHGQPIRRQFLFAILGLMVRQFILIIQGLYSIRQDLRPVALFTAFSSVCEVVATLSCTYVLPSTEGYLIGVCLGNVLSLAVWGVAAKRDFYFREIICGPLEAEMNSVMEFVRWNGISGLAGMLANQIDALVIGAIGSASALGGFNIASRLQQASYMGFAKGSDVLLPYFARLQSKPIEHHSLRFQTACWVTGTFGAMIMAPLLPLSDSLLMLWVGPENLQTGGGMLRTQVMCGLVGTASSVFWHYAMSAGYLSQLARISIMHSLISIALTVTLVPVMGVAAAGAGVLVAGMARYCFQIKAVRLNFGLNLSLMEVVLPSLLPFSVGVGVAVQVYWVGMVKVVNWFQLACAYGMLSMVVLFAIIVLSLLTGQGRVIIANVAGALK